MFSIAHRAARAETYKGKLVAHSTLCCCSGNALLRRGDPFPVGGSISAPFRPGPCRLNRACTGSGRTADPHPRNTDTNRSFICSPAASQPATEALSFVGRTQRGGGSSRKSDSRNVWFRTIHQSRQERAPHRQRRLYPQHPLQHPLQQQLQHRPQARRQRRHAATGPSSKCGSRAALAWRAGSPTHTPWRRLPSSRAQHSPLAGTILATSSVSARSAILQWLSGRVRD